MEHSETKNNNGLFLYKLKSKLIMPLAYFLIIIGVISLGGNKFIACGFILTGGLVVLKSKAMNFNFKRQSGHIIFNGDRGL